MHLTHKTAFDYALLDDAQANGFGELHFKFDAATGLQAIVAIHNTQLGPALGGCRCIEYPTVMAAVDDALRLAQGMSYKAAISDLPLGGGKAVLLRPKQIPDRKAYFQTLGRFIEELGGRYITAMDSGTYVSDMDAVATQTRHVVNTSQADGSISNPAPFTALGVRYGIEAAVRFRLGKTDLQGLHIAIQGVGHVGYYLAKELSALGATLSVCDINAMAVARCVNEFGAKAVSVTELLELDCDVYAPCALGGTVNPATIPHFKTKIIAGAANNQLADLACGNLLLEHDILYAPDYVINAGGVMHAFSLYQGSTQAALEANQRIQRIYQNLLNIFEISYQQNRATQEVADELAAAKLQRSS